MFQNPNLRIEKKEDLSLADVAQDCDCAPRNQKPRHGGPSLLQTSQKARRYQQNLGNTQVDSPLQAQYTCALAW